MKEELILKESPLFSFVHCSDLHLDSPFDGVHFVAPEIGTVLRDATFKALNNVIDVGIQEGADFLIVAGDVYDGEDRSLRAQLQFRDALRRAVDSEMQCFVAFGNHDPLSGWEAGLKVPNGVHYFSGDQVERIAAKRGGEELAYIYGISYPIRQVRENLALRFKGESADPFSIGVLHCNLGGDINHDNYAPCTIDDLVQCGMDYWALGHIHSRKVVRESDPCVIYPGNTQGRSVREIGECGCYLVRVYPGRRIIPEFISTDVVRWFVEGVDITELNGIDDLLQKLESKREEVRSQTMTRSAVLRFHLTGRGTLHAKLRNVDPERDIAVPLRESEVARDDFVWVESVQVVTSPPIDVEQRRKVQDFVGDFLRAAERLRVEKDKRNVLYNLITKRPEHRLIASQIDQLSDSELLAVVDNAETLVLDQLLTDEE
jgi:DNA repair exonuclease SbcCD nuclease subunit